MAKKTCFASVLSAAAFIYADAAQSSTRPSIQNENVRTTKDDRRRLFLKWFVDNGGTFYPISLDNDTTVNVTIENLPSFGGWGLALPIPLESSRTSNVCPVENTEGSQCTGGDEKSPVIRHLDPLFTVPASIIISVQSVLDAYAKTSSPLYLSDFYPRVNKILTEVFGTGLDFAKRSMGLVEQDVVIATYLMSEDCRHRRAHLVENAEDSRWAPYLDVLPEETIPRLDTFEDADYAALQDENLAFAGRNSRRTLISIYLAGDDGRTNGPSLKTVVQDMIRKNIDEVSLSTTIPESCVSFESFHRFVAIVSSRAMVLKGLKYLTPMAEMINYAPKGEIVLNNGKSRHWIQAPFELYHNFSEGSSITVRSDRDISLPSNDVPSIQLFEDYGPVDSSLFLEAHGFVPHENPNNCAIIPGSLFLRRNAAAGRYDENAELALKALKTLRLIHPDAKEFEALEDVCVKKNLMIIDDGNMIGRKPASDSIAIASLLLDDRVSEVWNQIENGYRGTFASLRDKCIVAIRSGDAEWMEINCARYPGSRSIVDHFLRIVARQAIANYEERGDTEARLLSQLQSAELQGRDQSALALRFRVQERRILSQIAHSDEMFGHDNGATNQIKPSERSESLEEKLKAFNSFVQSLKLPLNKIEPKITSNGMRIGTFAAEDLGINEAYISLPPDSVIDVATAMANLEEKSKLASLLIKYSHLNGPQRNDGFDTLLLYLLHERFVLKEQSKWWLYLNLLPSIEELSSFHPLFFQEEEIDRYLAGSDVRKFILRYQQRSAERHMALASDVDANLVLGSDVLLNKKKVYWATAILDSRSIWWNGRRHLSPLLDLVNADGKGRAHETRLEASREMNQNVAVTRASRRVGKGEQVFENYAQPNHLLFTYHGFLLDENPNDCALLDGLFVHRDDPGAKLAHRLHLTAASFCIRERASVEELARFLRVKHGLLLEHSSGWSIDDAVRPHLIQVLEGRVARLMEGLGTEINEFPLPRLRLMRQIVKNDLMHFRHALNSYVLV